MQQLLFLFVLMIIAAYWFDSVQVKELARRAGHFACKKHNVQFLDATVIKQSTRFKRHPNKLLMLQRSYSFEFSTDGEDRLAGFIVMNGHHLNELQMDLHTFDQQAGS